MCEYHLARCFVFLYAWYHRVVGLILVVAIIATVVASYSNSNYVYEFDDKLEFRTHTNDPIPCLCDEIVYSCSNTSRPQTCLPINSSALCFKESNITLPLQKIPKIYLLEERGSIASWHWVIIGFSIFYVGQKRYYAALFLAMDAGLTHMKKSVEENSEAAKFISYFQRADFVIALLITQVVGMVISPTVDKCDTIIILTPDKWISQVAGLLWLLNILNLFCAQKCSCLCSPWVVVIIMVLPLLFFLIVIPAAMGYRFSTLLAWDIIWWPGGNVALEQTYKLITSYRFLLPLDIVVGVLTFLSKKCCAKHIMVAALEQHSGARFPSQQREKLLSDQSEDQPL